MSRQASSSHTTTTTTTTRSNTYEGFSIVKTRNVSPPQNNNNNNNNKYASRSHSNSQERISSVRLQETQHGIKVRGAQVVVTRITTAACNDSTHPAANNNATTNRDQCAQQPTTTTKVQGKVFENISISSDMIMLHQARYSKQDEARQAIADQFGVPLQDVSREFSLEIYPTPYGDFLAYFGDVLVNAGGSTSTQLYDVVIDSRNMTLLCKCLVGGARSLVISTETAEGTAALVQPTHPTLRTNADGIATTKEIEKQINKTCGDGCAEHLNEELEDGIVWSRDVSSCPLQSLYLNNTYKTMPCTSGETRNGTRLFGPGPIPSLFWGGTYDCHSSTDEESCQLVPLFQQCNDAMSDVQFVATKTMQFLEDQILGEDVLTRNPKPVRAFVHYDEQFCNAFFRGSEDTIFFGDCDCKNAGPMVSLDIVAHEISHFLTWHTSRLAHGYQSGGLSEGFGDILGTMMEWIIDDELDRPDFVIGESTGHIMRNMEHPSTIEGLDTVCQFDVLTSTSVHATSGPLNKAYVLSVRACQQGGCASSTTECVVLMGSIFLYSNLHKLSMYSGYLDAATASCDSVEELFLERAPNTTCSGAEAKSFIKSGWEGADVVFSGLNTCRARKRCQGELRQSTATRAFLALANFLNGLARIRRSVFH